MSTFNQFQLFSDLASADGCITSVSRIPNSMEVFWINKDGSVHGAYWYDGSNWGNYELAPAGSASTNGSIAAVSRIPNSMEVFWVGQNGSIQDAYWYEGANWQHFELAPAGSASTNGSITVVSRIPNSMELWFIGNNGSVQDGYWYDSNAKLALKRRLSISGSIFVRDDDEGTNSEQDRNILGAIEFDNKLQGVFEFIKKAPNGQIGKIAFVTNLNSDNSISIHREASCTDSDTQTKDITLTVDNEFHEQIHCEHNPTIGARNWADFNINLKNESFLSDKVLNSITLHKNIVTGGIDAFGGWVEVTINRDGNIRFKGHCHDSGFESYNFNIRTIVHSESPIVLAMQKSGHVEGTTHSGIFDAPRRDFDWDETTFNPNITSSFDDIIKNITMDVYSSDSGDISSTLEDIANFAIRWIAGSILINPLTGLIIFVGVEIGSIATGAGFAGGARVISNILWCAGPFGTLYAIAAEGIAKLGENERELTDYEYNFANTNIFKGMLPAKGDIILTNTIGGNNRAFTMPRFDGKITVNMGEDGFVDPVSYRLDQGWKKGQVFIHELTHAWQIKNTNWSLSLMASALASKICEVGGGDPYNFGTDATKPFGDFNLEQQAHIVDAWFASCAIDNNENIIDNILSPWYHFIEGNIRVGQPS